MYKKEQIGLGGQMSVGIKVAPVDGHDVSKADWKGGLPSGEPWRTMVFK